MPRTQNQKAVTQEQAILKLRGCATPAELRLIDALAKRAGFYWPCPRCRHDNGPHDHRCGACGGKKIRTALPWSSLDKRVQEAILWAETHAGKRVKCASLAADTIMTVSGAYYGDGRIIVSIEGEHRPIDPVTLANRNYHWVGETPCNGYFYAREQLTLVDE